MDTSSVLALVAIAVLVAGFGYFMLRPEKN